MAYATPMALPFAPQKLADAPRELRKWSTNFSSFNPALLQSPDDRLIAFFRVSNMHFCGDRRSWRDSVKLQQHIRSYMGQAMLDMRDWSLLTPATVLRAATSLFSPSTFF